MTIKRKARRASPRLSKARLDRLVEEAVIVERVDLTQSEDIVAVCRRAGVRQTIPILDLPLPSPRPAGAEWIDAYRHWVVSG